MDKVCYVLHYFEAEPICGVYADKKRAMVELLISYFEWKEINFDYDEIFNIFCSVPKNYAIAGKIDDDGFISKYYVIDDASDLIVGKADSRADAMSIRNDQLGSYYKEAIMLRIEMPEWINPSVVSEAIDSLFEEEYIEDYCEICETYLNEESMK